MKIAVVGSGISGLVCAYLLGRSHEVKLFEASNKAGGHVHTVDAQGGNGSHRVDMGFIVFNETNYPGFCKLLEKLDVGYKTSRMGFSVSDKTSNIEYSGESFRGLFGSVRNITDPYHYKMVVDILKFHKLANTRNLKESETIEEFVTRYNFGHRFQSHYLFPLGSALWSCPENSFSSFPMEFVVDFFSNHKMLQIKGRPVWRVIEGGSSTYVEKIVKILGNRIVLNTPVLKVSRNRKFIEVVSQNGIETYDEAILACHANQSLRLLQYPTKEEEDALKCFPYEQNQVLLHTDSKVLPKRKSAWASWNAKSQHQADVKSTVTYNMNILQGINDKINFCVSLNQTDLVDSNKHIQEEFFEHPMYTTNRKNVQSNHRNFIRNNGISLCGAYWGYGFHEDGLQSALRVSKEFGEELR